MADSMQHHHRHQHTYSKDGFFNNGETTVVQGEFQHSHPHDGPHAHHLADDIAHGVSDVVNKIDDTVTGTVKKVDNTVKRSGLWFGPQDDQAE